MYVINNALCLQDNRLAVEDQLMSRKEPKAITHQIMCLMIPCQLAKTPEWRCRVNVKILIGLNSLCVVAGAPSTLVKAGSNINKEIAETVGEVGVETNSCRSSVDTMNWLSFPVQEIHER